MKKLRKRLKTYYYKHWNCLPWFICGLMILIRGDISRFNYGSMWIALLIMMWFFCPTEDINKLSETESKGDDDMLVLPIKNGYSRSSRQAKATCTLTKGTGNPEWGAEPGTIYYVLHIKQIEEMTT